MTSPADANFPTPIEWQLKLPPTMAFELKSYQERLAEQVNMHQLSVLHYTGIAAEVIQAN